MERTTKLVIVIWAASMLVVELAIGRAWAGMPVAATVSFIAAAVLTAYDARAVGLVLALACVFPAVVRLALETYAVQFDVLWMAALLGAVTPDALRTRWHIPYRWRGALVCAALAVAVSTPLVALREIDFNTALLGPMPGAVLSGLPRFVVEWVVQVGLTLVLGILWFDWLCGPRVQDFESTIVRPMAVGMVVMAGVAVYQMFGNIAFLNETAYAAIGRAGGTMYDANVCGTLAAMGLGVAIGYASRERGWWRGTAWFLVLLFAMAVWATGSRTAAAATIIVIATSAASAWWARDRARPLRISMPVIGGVVGVLVVLTAIVLAVDTNSVGPVRRLWETLPGVSGLSFRQVAVEMWNRNGYGTASTDLIRRFPLSGIGIGGFHMFGPQLSHIGPIPPDNAQNWLRHQVVELGFLGAAGWLVFAVLFGWFVLTPRRGLPAIAGPVRGVLIAFGLISLLGMPTQQVTAAIVFWTAAAWYGRLAQADDNPRPLGRRIWIAIGLLTLAFAASTWQAATTDLRVAARARQIGWPFSYGLYDPEPDGTGGEVRWTADRASALVDVHGPVMTITVRAPHPDISSVPISVKVWVEGRLVINTRLTSGDPVTASVPVPPELRQTLIDARVSRTVRPRDFGVADDRELGVLMKWTFASGA